MISGCGATLFGNLAVGLVLFFLRRHVVAIEVKKFGAIEADSFGAIGCDRRVNSSGNSMFAERTMCRPSRVVDFVSRNSVSALRYLLFPGFDFVVVPKCFLASGYR